MDLLLKILNIPLGLLMDRTSFLLCQQSCSSTYVYSYSHCNFLFFFFWFVMLHLQTFFWTKMYVEKCHFVCRHFKLILQKNVDVLSSDFKAFVVDAGNRQRSIDIDGEFYHGFEQCKFFYP